jgi:hypothetical protein
MTTEHAGGPSNSQPSWPTKAIRDMTVNELTAVLRHLAGTTVDDAVLVQALHTELTLRQAGIRPGRINGALDDTRTSELELAAR